MSVSTVGHGMSGLASDTKVTGLEAGSLFYETDTHKLFGWDGATWDWVSQSALTSILASNNTWTGTNNYQNTITLEGFNELRFRDGDAKIYSTAVGYIDVSATGPMTLAVAYLGLGSDTHISYATDTFVSGNAVELTLSGETNVRIDINGVNEVQFSDNLMKFEADGGGTDVQFSWSSGTLNFQVGGSTEISYIADRLTTNNGATDMALGWATNAQWDFLSGGTIYASWTSTGVTFEAGATDVGIKWDTSATFKIQIGANTEFKVLSTGFTFGSAAAGQDYTITCDGETNDGVIVWMEDEDAWKFSDDLWITGTERMYVGSSRLHWLEDFSGLDTILRINSQAGVTISVADVDKYSFLGSAITPATGVSVDVGSSSSPFINIYASTSVQIKAGTSTAFSKAGGTIKVDTTQTGNVGTGEDTLQTYSIPANTLSTNGMYICWFASGTDAATAVNKRYRFKYGGTTLLDTGALAITLASDWSAWGRIYRTGATTQKAWSTFVCSDAAVKEVVDYTTPGETLSGAVTFLITGEATNNNDCVKETFEMGWGPNA